MMVCESSARILNYVRFIRWRNTSEGSRGVTILVITYQDCS